MLTLSLNKISTIRTQYSSGWWLEAVLFSILFIPNIRLMSSIPFRVDDILLISALILPDWHRGYAIVPIPKSLISVTLIVNSFYMLLVTAIVSTTYGEITFKEYLDPLRPLKFMIIFEIVARMNYPDLEKRFLKFVSIATLLLSGLGVLQIAVLTRDSDNLFARFCIALSEMPEDVSRIYLGYRPFATFNTPTDFGYVMSFCFCTAYCFRKMPARIFALSAALVGIVVSGTRTFLFSLPIILLIHGLLYGKNPWKKILFLFKGIFFTLTGLLVLLFIFPNALFDISLSLNSMRTGEYQKDYSISYRLGNLDYAKTALNIAPLTGLVTRAVLPTAVDSEYVATVVRYGLLGILSTISVYFSVVLLAWKSRSYRDLSLSLLMIVLITFIYGITQGAFVNTRIGPILFLHAGMVGSALRTKLFETGLASCERGLLK